MKKKEKYYAINTQEDEDGFTLYPGYLMIYETDKKKQASSNSKLRMSIAQPTMKLGLYHGERVSFR